MKKSLVLSIAALITLFVNAAVVQAETQQGYNNMPPQNMNFHRMEQFDNNDMRHNPHNFKGPHPSKAEMQSKRLEFEKRLNLTEEQKKAIEANKEKDREKIKPVIDEIRAKDMEMRRINSDTSLSDEAKAKKQAEINKDITNLKQKADKYRQENMKKFESVLDDNQKKEFAKIKEEQKQVMEQRKKQFEQNLNQPSNPVPIKPPYRD